MRVARMPTRRASSDLDARNLAIHCRQSWAGGAFPPDRPASRRVRGLGRRPKVFGTVTQKIEALDVLSFGGRAHVRASDCRRYRKAYREALHV